MPLQSFVDGSESPVIYLAFDPEFLQLTNQTALGIPKPLGGTVKWIDASPEWLNKFSCIPHDKDSNEFAPMFSLATWMGLAGQSIWSLFLRMKIKRKTGRLFVPNSQLRK